MAAIILLVASCGKTEQNPLLSNFDTPHQTPPFDKIKAEHYEPAFDVAIEEAKKEVEQIASSKETPTFENTIVALDNIGEKMNAISGIFFNLNACLTDSLMQDIAQNFIQPRYLYEPATFRTGKTSSRAKSNFEPESGTGHVTRKHVESLHRRGSKPRRCRPRTFQRDFHRTR